MFGHRRVAIALDDVNRDAEGGQRFRVHVAAGAGAEKDDVFQAGAATHRLRRQSAVIVEQEVVAGQEAREIGRVDLALFVERDRGIAGSGHRVENVDQLVIRVEENTAHPLLPHLDADPACAPLTRQERDAIAPDHAASAPAGDHRGVPGNPGCCIGATECADHRSDPTRQAAAPRRPLGRPYPARAIRPRTIAPLAAGPASSWPSGAY